MLTKRASVYAIGRLLHGKMDVQRKMIQFERPVGTTDPNFACNVLREEETFYVINKEVPAVNFAEPEKIVDKFLDSLERRSLSRFLGFDPENYKWILLAPTNNAIKAIRGPWENETNDNVAFATIKYVMQGFLIKPVVQEIMNTPIGGLGSPLTPEYVKTFFANRGQPEGYERHLGRMRSRFAKAAGKDKTLDDVKSQHLRLALEKLEKTTAYKLWKADCIAFLNRLLNENVLPLLYDHVDHFKDLAL